MGRKRKPEEAQNSAEDTSNKRKPKMDHQPTVNPPVQPNNQPAISPTSKIQVLKIDVFSCNGQAIHQSTELGAPDLENIWTQSLGRSLEEVIGYFASKNKSGEIRIQYQLKRPMSIRDIISEQEFTYERSTVFATDNFKCKAIGLNDVRQAQIGEVVKVTVNLPNFDITPDQIIEWISKFGIIKEGHRYTTLPTIFLVVYTSKFAEIATTYLISY
jgi:hypothetical protein